MEAATIPTFRAPKIQIYLHIIVKLVSQVPGKGHNLICYIPKLSSYSFYTIFLKAKNKYHFDHLKVRKLNFEDCESINGTIINFQ